MWFCKKILFYSSVSGTESKHSWLPEGQRSCRGNPKLVARHSLSISTQSQALTALTLSAIRGGSGTIRSETSSEGDKKLPPQVLFVHAHVVDIYQSIHSFLNPSIHSSIYPSIHSFINLSPFIYLSIYPFIYLSIHSSTIH